MYQNHILTNPFRGYDNLSESFIPIRFSITIGLPHKRYPDTSLSAELNNIPILIIGINEIRRSHFFRDINTGTMLQISPNSAFRLTDVTGYNSGLVPAQQTVNKNNVVTIWHQDNRFSFTCHANLPTGFCFGWLIDRAFGKSWRILDPGLTDYIS